MFGLGLFESLAFGLGAAVVGFLLTYSAIRRVKNKLDPANKPTRWQYINELGGYFFIGIILLINAIVSVVMGIASLFN